MRRRQFISLFGGATLGGAAFALSFATRAQQKAMPVIGYLSIGSSSGSELTNPYVAAFRQGLGETGYVEART